MSTNNSTSRFVECLRMQRAPSDKATPGVEVYETLQKPYPASASVPDIAFGGLTVAQAIMAAFHSLYVKQGAENAARQQQEGGAGSAEQGAQSATDKAWTIYTCLGNFLGPISTHSLVRLEVTTIRGTRSFETRLVRVLQIQKPKAPRGKGAASNDSSSSLPVKAAAKESEALSSFSSSAPPPPSLPVWTTRFISTIDFCRRSQHVQHPLTKDSLHYSIKPHAMRAAASSPESMPPSRSPLSPEDAEDIFAMVERKLQDGSIPKWSARLFHAIFDGLDASIHMRYLPGSLCEQTIQGCSPVDKEQLSNWSDFPDASSIVDGVWMRSSKPLQDIWTRRDERDSLPMSNASLAASFRAMALDPRPVVTVPLFHRLGFGRDIVAQSLDTAIRFHVQENDDEIAANASDWHLIESISRVEGHGRYFGESTCFDRQCRVVATSSQQCAMQVLPPRKPTDGTKADSRAKL